LRKTKKRGGVKISAITQLKKAEISSILVDGVKFEIKLLSAKNLERISNLSTANLSEQFRAVKDIILKSVTGATDEEIDALSIDNLQNLAKAIINENVRKVRK